MTKKIRTAPSPHSTYSALRLVFDVEIGETGVLEALTDNSQQYQRVVVSSGEPINVSIVDGKLKVLPSDVCGTTPSMIAFVNITALLLRDCPYRRTNILSTILAPTLTFDC